MNWWIKHIYFINEYAEDMDLAGFVGYGLSVWPSRSLWLVPGTCEE